MTENECRHCKGGYRPHCIDGVWSHGLPGGRYLCTKKRVGEAPTLKVFEVAIDPVETHNQMGDWRYVMVLSKDEESAVDSAFYILALPNGRADLTWTVTEQKGPFVNGSVLSIKTIPAK